MTANQIYNKAINNGVEFECDCSGVSLDRWEELMEGATKANKKWMTKFLVSQGHLEPDWLKWWNPYDCYKTDTHLIFVHSAIEHFYKIN